MQTNRFIQLVDQESASLSYTKEEDVPCLIDRFNGFYETLVSRQMRYHNEFQTASLVWQKHEALPGPPMISIMSLFGGEL